MRTRDELKKSSRGVLKRTVREDFLARTPVSALQNVPRLIASEVGKCLVGLSHLVSVGLLLNCIPLVVIGIQEFIC